MTKPIHPEEVPTILPATEDTKPVPLSAFFYKAERNCSLFANLVTKANVINNDAASDNTAPNFSAPFALLSKIVLINLH